MEHSFTPKIFEILRHHFGDLAQDVYDKSTLLQYINFKTRSATQGSKSRANFANHYALYSLIEDYIQKNFLGKETYKDYEGAIFTELMRRQHELPFGSKLQNHALNGRMNDEFMKFFPTSEQKPILRNSRTKRYWINENLLKVVCSGQQINTAIAVIEIIDAYIAAKRDAFNLFIDACQKIQSAPLAESPETAKFIESLLQPNIDARLFEIVSFAILKAYYGTQSIFWGFEREAIGEEVLTLYKTGRTNANDGGIDFVMRPLGRFFQVTETVDVRKYFLDIDKIQHFPLTFVIKSQETPEALSTKIRQQAEKHDSIRVLVDQYMECIEEIINIPILLQHFHTVVAKQNLFSIMDEIVLQSKIEFNIQDDIDEETKELSSEENEGENIIE